MNQRPSGYEQERPTLSAVESIAPKAKTRRQNAFCQLKCSYKLDLQANEVCQLNRNQTARGTPEKPDSFEQQPKIFFLISFASFQRFRRNSGDRSSPFINSCACFQIASLSISSLSIFSCNNSHAALNSSLSPVSPWSGAWVSFRERTPLAAFALATSINQRSKLKHSALRGKGSASTAVGESSKSAQNKQHTRDAGRALDSGNLCRSDDLELERPYVNRITLRARFSFPRLLRCRYSTTCRRREDSRVFSIAQPATSLCRASSRRPIERMPNLYQWAHAYDYR